jgi:hypothetical protein
VGGLMMSAEHAESPRATTIATPNRYFTSM